MMPVKTILLAAALSFGTTAAIAQEGGAGERPTTPYAQDAGSNYEIFNERNIREPRLTDRRVMQGGSQFFSSDQNEGEFGDSYGTTGTGMMNQQLR